MSKDNTEKFPKDDSEEFAKSRFNLGFDYLQQGKIDKAIEVWKKIDPVNNPKQFFYAQFNLGMAYTQQEKTEEAIKAWEKIRRKEDPVPFSVVQFNLGVAYARQGKTEEAIKAYKRVLREDNPEQFASAQFNLGVTYAQQGKTKEAIKAYERVLREDNPEQFAYAQFNLGVIYVVQKKTKEAIKAWEKISEKDKSKTFINARFALGNIYIVQGETKKAKEVLEKIKINGGNDKSSYLLAIEQLISSKYFILTQEASIDPKVLDNVKKFLDECKILEEYKPENLPYTLKSLYLFLFSISKQTENINKQKEISTALYGLYIYRELILESLLVTDKKVSHYTSINTAKKIFEEKEKNLRLSLLTVSNDPTEGKVFLKYLNMPDEFQKRSKYPFGACFTFELDSLNQLRLYGKENNEEATGMALILSPNFFSENRTFNQSQDQSPNFVYTYKGDDSTKYQNGRSNIDSPMQNEKLEIEINSNSVKDNDKKLPLYRCIYLAENVEKDDFICQVAAPSKATRFFQGNKNYFNDDNDILNKEVKGQLKEMKDLISEIIDCMKEVSTEDKEKLIDLIMKIILPIQYLTKDIAFQEERECRILKTVSDINETDESIQSIKKDDNIFSIYISYEIPLNEHLEYAIIHEKQKAKAPYLKRHLRKEVRISRNPYRR